MKHILLAALALLIFLTVTPDPLRISPDSEVYLSAAASFRAGRGFLRPEGTPLTILPPLTSILLAFIPARLLNATGFATTVLLSERLLARMVPSRPLYMAGLVLVLLADPLHYVYGWVWSESVFIPLVLAVFVLLPHVDQPRALIAAAVCTALAMLTRYSGVTLFAVAALAVAWTRRKRGWFGLAALGTYGFVAALPLALWLARNAALGETIGNRARPPIWDLPTALADTARTLVGWPGRDALLLPVLLLAIMEIRRRWALLRR